jgi:hypothetical protein
MELTWLRYNPTCNEMVRLDVVDESIPGGGPNDIVRMQMDEEKVKITQRSGDVWYIERLQVVEWA